MVTVEEAAEEGLARGGPRGGREEQEGDDKEGDENYEDGSKRELGIHSFLFRPHC